MAEEIRGLSVKFDADFSEFKKNMKNAEKDIKSTQTQLKSLQDSLKIKWDEKKFTQAQEQAQKALKATEEKASLLKKRLSKMERAGVTDKTREEYNFLQEQLSKTELSAQKLNKTIEDLGELKLKGLTSGLDAATDKLDKAAQKTKAISAASAALGAGLVAAGLNAVEEADEIATLATQYDMTTEAIQRFNYVALQTDTQSEALYKGFVKVQGAVADLKTGVNSVSTQALQQLGLNFDKFKGKEDQFYGIIDALSRLEDQEKMVSLANDIFGEKMATNLFPLIYAGTDAISEYRQEFEQMGALTDDQIQDLAAFDNVMNQLKTQYANTALQLGSSLLPVMQEFSAFLTDDILPVARELVEWYKGLDENQQKILLSLILLTAALSPALKMFSSVGKGVSSLIQWFGKLDKAALTTMGNIALVGAALGSVISLIGNWSKLSTVGKILHTLATAALVAAAAIAVFHASWSVGLAIGAIVAGIAAATAAVAAAGKDIGAEVSFNSGSYNNSVSIPSYDVPSYSNSGGLVTNNDNTSYIDNSNITINIEKNEYMSEEDIIQAVNKGLKEARLSRA